MFTRGRTSQHPSRSSRRFAWVLALALLLPFAQALAWVHTLSHGTQREHAAASQFDTPCALCLSAAPLHGGALPSTQPAALEPPLAQACAPGRRPRGASAHRHPRLPQPRAAARLDLTANVATRLRGVLPVVRRPGKEHRPCAIVVPASVLLALSLSWRP